jgi:fatty-acyl-CoA synthase
MLYSESAQPIRNLDDIKAMERTPLAERMWSLNINDWIDRGLKLSPGKSAIRFFADGQPHLPPAQEWTCEELGRHATQVANALHRGGVGAGEVVLYLLPTTPQHYAVMLGALKLGVACCVNPMLKSAQLLDLIRSSKAKAIVCLGPTEGHDVWERLQSVADRLPPGTKVYSARALPGTQRAANDLDDLAAAEPGDRLHFDRTVSAQDVAAYVHSGGTTGSPKLVQITHGGLCYKAWANAIVMGHSESDVIFSDYPMFHVAGFLSRGVLAAACGMSIVIPSPLGARDKNFIAHYWDFVERFGINILSGVPTTLSVLAKTPPTGQNLSSLRPYMCTGSTALPVEVGKAIERMTGVRVLLTYGGTEYTQNVTQGPRDGELKYGSVGLRLPYSHVRIAQLDADGNVERDCGTNEIGIVLVKGPSVSPGYVDAYYNDGVYTADGWFNSGDLGRIDEDEYLWITGRAKDVIIRGGHNIDPSVIEEALRAHPDVVHVAAVGKPDAHAGELPVAYVQLVPGAQVSEAALQDFAREHVPEQAAAPKDVFVMDSLPLTHVGKPDKVTLRRDAAMRVFRPLLEQAVGAAHVARLEHVDDAEHGQVLTCFLQCADAAQRTQIEASARDAMKLFQAPFKTSWLSEAKA